MSFIQRAQPWAMSALVVAACACATAAQAQSSYSLTVLKPPSKGGVYLPDMLVAPDTQHWMINAGDQVVATVSDVTKYTYSIQYLFSPRPVFDDYVYRWPAGTGTSVSGSRLTSSPNALLAASGTGKKLVLRSGLYDLAASKALGALPAALAKAVVVNDSGVVVAGPVYAQQWTPGQANGQTLPSATGQIGEARAINASGLVAGAVVNRSNFLQQAAVWSSGAVQVMPGVSGVSSLVTQVNDKGQMVVMRAPQLDCVDTEVIKGCKMGPRSVFLREPNGVETALLGAGDERRLGRMLLNNAGVVVGCQSSPTTQVPVVNGFSLLSPTLDQSSCLDGGRAYIWQKGVLSDLTTYVTSKGVKLPAGAVLTDVVAINDKGSLVAQMNVGTAKSLVRLTAKP